MPDPRQTREFLRAVKHGALPLVQEYLSQDADLATVCEEDGATPLHYAAWKGHPEVATALLTAGAAVDAHSRNEHWGGTPLHAAAHGNQKAVAEVLLAHGATVNAVSANGRTPLQETAFHKATAVANLLKRHGAC